jgi:ABC-type nickel/cobalt efflux system permease component RcnA
MTRTRLLLALSAVAAVIVLLGHDPAFAGTPFGVARPDAQVSGAPGLFLTWLMGEQSGFYKGLADAIRASKANGSIAFALVGLSLAYGVFQAAGPGHGKAIISGYLFATGETLKKGIVLAFVSAAVQALAAILIVAILSIAIGATARQMDDATAMLEMVAYGAMALIGLVLVLRKGAALLALVAPGHRLAAAGGPHVHDASCGHVHAPLPGAGRPFDLRGAIATVLAIGVRPCTGAIIVLVFALAQGVFWTGVAATFAMALGTAVTVSAMASLAVFAKSAAVRLAAPDSHGAAVALGTLELVAALAVLLIGVALLAGVAMLPGPG